MILGRYSILSDISFHIKLVAFSLYQSIYLSIYMYYLLCITYVLTLARLSPSQ